MSESLQEYVIDSDPEPEPFSYEWKSDNGDSYIALDRNKIIGKMGEQAFLNYIDLSVDDRHRLERYASEVMDDINQDEEDRHSIALINYVPLLFTPRHVAIVGARERDDFFITFESDEITLVRDRDVLVGGLATLLYFMDHPSELQSVE